MEHVYRELLPHTEMAVCDMKTVDNYNLAQSCSHFRSGALNAITLSGRFERARPR